MKSKWFKLKGRAQHLRRKGYSVRKIERNLGIPRSTLSGWLRDIKLTDLQKKKLLRDWKEGLVTARKKAVLWHNNQKEERIKEAEKEALKTLAGINIEDKKILELTLSILYLGEGAKKSEETAIGSSDPLILKFFLTILRMLYKIDADKIKCQLNLRADQSPQEMRHFWATELNLPETNFTYIALDKRTIGTKTYPSYKGVCHIRCGSAAIQRKLIYLSNEFCEKVIKNYSGTWRSGSAPC